ncbi:MAG TPA: cache domain-containing protein [Nitrososphaera sp.]|nr:cache domain-containing protein [Nitrososphaera sp.]
MSSASTPKIALIVAVAAAIIAAVALAVSLNTGYGFIGTLDWKAKSQAQDMASTVSSKNNVVKLIAADVENRINDSIAVMQLTSELPQVRSTKYLDSISTAQMGIPEDKDIEKRAVARQILSQHTEFASIFFLTTSGDIYIGEPFEQQKQLPKLNYAERDWYKGASATNDTYVSSVFMSAAIHVPAVAIAVPVYAGDGESQVAGYWVAIVNLADVESNLMQLDLGDGKSRILLVDHNGTEIADTGRISQDKTDLKSFIALKSVKDALSGQTGSEIEEVDGSKMIASFASLQAHPHIWAVVLLEPADNIAMDNSSQDTLYTSPYIRTDIIISTKRSDMTVVDEKMFEEIQTELAEKFGGVTRYPSFNGTSMNAGVRRDGINNTGFFVVAPNTQENIEWFSSYKETLKSRLNQESIFMTISPSMIV